MKTKLHIISLIAIVAIILPASAFAGVVTLEGVIKGAYAVIRGEVGPANSDDPLVAIERDFVLTTSSAYHFLTNVPRSRKVELIGKEIVVTGKKRAKGIFVDRIESKNGKLLYSRDAEHSPEDDRDLTITRGWAW
jgi:hypothetical protein